MVYNMEKESFSQALNRLMLERGINQSQLAERSGVTREYINMVLKGKRKGRPSMDTVLAFAKVLDVDPKEFYGTSDVELPRKTLKAVLLEASRLAKQLEDGIELITPSTKYVSLHKRGDVSAGTHEVREEEPDVMVDIPSYLIPEGVAHDKLFVLKVHGESLTGDNIHDGFDVIVRMDAEFTQGSIYVVKIDNHVSLRHVTKLNGEIKLWSSNAHYKEQIVKKETVEIQGKVVESGFHQHHN